jgi:hypothetical protein
MKNAIAVQYSSFLGLPLMERPSAATVLPSLRGHTVQPNPITDVDFERDLTAMLAVDAAPLALAAAAK